MLTPSQLKLIELMKTDEQVRWLIEKQWDVYYINYNWEIVKELKSKYIELITNDNFEKIKKWKNISKEDIWKYYNSPANIVWELIWLQLSEHFIRLYCLNKNVITQIKSINYIDRTWLYINENFICNLDNTRDFNSQSDECYNSIYEALINL